MANQIFIEDIEAGTEITPLVKQPTTRQLVQWAGASSDFAEIHYDKDIAMARDLPGVVVHGALKSAWLGQLLTDWIGEAGVLKEMMCQYRGLNVPGVDLVCKGKVVKKYDEGGEHLVDCEIWTENPEGERTTTGTATVALPSRG